MSLTLEELTEFMMHISSIFEVGLLSYKNYGKITTCLINITQIKIGVFYGRDKS
jgi:hypothetical protein